MNTKRTILFLVGIALLLPFSISGLIVDPDPADPVSTIRFVNVGKMHVAVNGPVSASPVNVTLYIPNTTSKMLGENVVVTQLGKTATKRNFYNNLSGTTNQKRIYSRSTALYLG